MMMMMPRLQKWGSFFLPRKQKSLSLSFSRAQNTQPRACARRTSLFRFTRMKKPLSDLSLLLRKSAFERVYKFYYTLFCRRIQVVSLSSRLLGKMKLSSVCAFSSSFFILSFSSRVLVFGSSFSPPALMNKKLFSKREDEKVESTPNTLVSLWLFLWENALLSIRFTHPHKITFPYSLYSSSFSEDALA